MVEPGRHKVLSSNEDSDDSSEHQLDGKADCKASRNFKKKSKTKEWDRLYKFAIQRGTSDFKIPELVIDTIFKTLRWGHHIINKGGGAEAKMVDAAPKLKANIKPSKIGTSVNVFEWIKLLNDETEDVCWPMWFRIQWVCKSGGLANGVENSYRDLITTSLKNPAEKLNDYEGKPYDRTHDRDDQWYWDCMWVELLLWIISNFYLPTTDNEVAEVIKKFLRESLELNTDPDKPPQDAFTREAQSVHFALQKAYRMAEESLSNLPANPQYIYEFLIEVLKKKTTSEEAPQGEMIARELEQSRERFARNPGEFITSRLPLSDDEIRTIRHLGPSKLTEKHFKMITQSLMEKVRMGQPFYRLHTIGEMRAMSDFYAKRRGTDDLQSKKQNTSSSETDSSDEADSQYSEGEGTEKSPKEKKVNNVNTGEISQQSSDEDESSGQSSDDSKTIATMEEDYFQSGDSSDSGGRE